MPGLCPGIVDLEAADIRILMPPAWRVWIVRSMITSTVRSVACDLVLVNIVDDSLLNRGNRIRRTMAVDLIRPYFYTSDCMRNR
jgi:hypothetical protein